MSELSCFKLPYGNPRSCDWCEEMIDLDENARYVLAYYKPFSQRCRMKYNGYKFEIVCAYCYDWSCKHEGLEKHQEWLIHLINTNCTSIDG